KGDLGYLTPGSLNIKKYNDFAFENKTGDKEVIETEYGYFIVHIEDQKNIQKAIKVVNIIKSVQPSEKTINQTFVKATRFESNASGNDFIAAAKEEMLDVRPVKRIGEL